MTSAFKKWVLLAPASVAAMVAAYVAAVLTMNLSMWIGIVHQNDFISVAFYGFAANALAAAAGVGAGVHVAPAHKRVVAIALTAVIATFAAASWVFYKPQTMSAGWHLWSTLAWIFGAILCGHALHSQHHDEAGLQTKDTASPEPTRGTEVNVPQQAPSTAEKVEPAPAPQTTAGPSQPVPQAGKAAEFHHMVRRYQADHQEWLDWSPEITMPAELTAVTVPPGHLTESQWLDALADRVQKMVMEEPDPTAALKWACRALNLFMESDVDRAGAALVLDNWKLQDRFHMAVWDEDPFPTNIKETSLDAKAAMDACDFQLWVDLARSEMTDSSGD